MRSISKLNFVLLISIFNITHLGAQDFYDPENISAIEIDFYDTDWKSILNGFMAEDSDERILADVTINGEYFDSAGVRFKGNSSYNSSRIKNPLNIKLNYVKDQDYHGYYTLKLSNGFKDPSFVREVLALEIARKYMPAPKAGYSKVTINGEYIGLYTNVQSVNDVFTREHYFSEDRPFFEGAGDGPRPPGCYYGIWDYMGPDFNSCYTYYYDSKSGDQYSWLIDFLDTFNNVPNEMESVYNVDRHLWSMAFDIALVNLDAPISMPHNFYLYYDITNRFNYIKWDLNECFGVFQRLQNLQLNITQMQQLDPFTNNNPDSPILYKIWQNDRWKRMYLAHMITLMEENINNNWYMERAAELQEIIAKTVQNDPNQFYSYNEFLSNLDQQVDKSVGISQLMDNRADYLSGTPYFQQIAPEITAIHSFPEQFTPGSELTILANITNASYASLAFRNTLGARFDKVEMFDDGMHNDGEAGDGTWGATFTPEGAFMHYYIYAENEKSGKFSPSRAEYDYYALYGSSGIVINEFLASNTNSDMDMAGENDDWIELFNTGESAVNLSGFYLSDEISDPFKWTFPDTTIGAGDYLVVWADRDTLQEGLHANFKLSASAEEISISDNTGMVLDQISFPAQISDISYGRYPNGRGEFVFLVPTIGAENKDMYTGIVSYPDQLIPPELFLYPNPAQNELNIYIADHNEHTVRIYNMSGQLCGTWQVNETLSVDISNFSPGLYIITSYGLAPGKFIKK
jgi:hypothetical protein